MKNLFVGLVLFASTAAFTQQYNCNTKFGYSCAQSTEDGFYSRNALCFAYGEEVLTIDKSESNKLFKNLEACESYTSSSYCEAQPMREKLCSEIGGEYVSKSATCYICQ